MSFLDFIEQLKWVQAINISFIDVIQIIVLSFALYYLSKTLYKTRAWVLVKGLFVIGVVYLVICLTKMTVLQMIMQGVFSFLMIAIIIMLQPELQKIVELIGKKNLNNVKSLFVKKQDFDEWLPSDSIKEVVDACEEMSKAKTGALIVIERGIPLHDCIDSGIKLSSHISKQLLINIFEKNTPLHDGAIVIKDNKIESATCYLPLSTNMDVDKELGTRHRAALGISENTDCLTVVVSEETGAISFCEGEKLHRNISKEKLTEFLTVSTRKSEDLVVRVKKRNKGPLWIKFVAPLLGFVIWLSVMVVSDPLTTKVIDNVNVDIINEQVLDEAGHSYTIKDGDSISIKVKGKRSSVDGLTANDIIATADLSNMSIVYSVPIDIKINGEKDVEVLTTNKMVHLKLENIVRVEVPIEPVIAGDSNNNYAVIVKDVEVDSLAVSCPESIAKTLDKAVVTVDAYNKTNDFSVLVNPVIYDKNGSIVSENKLGISHESIRVVIDVCEVKEVPITITLSEQKETGEFYYVLNSYEYEDETIKVAVTDDELEFEELSIQLSPDQNSESVNSALINLTKYLPEGVVLAKTQQEQITVDLDLTRYIKMVLALSGKDVRLYGYDTEKFEAAVESVPSFIMLYYNESSIDPKSINIELLNPSVKIQRSSAGKYVDPATMTDIDGVNIVGEVKVKYALKERS